MYIVNSEKRKGKSARLSLKKYLQEKFKSSY